MRELRIFLSIVLLIQLAGCAVTGVSPSSRNTIVATDAARVAQTRALEKVDVLVVAAEQADENATVDPGIVLAVKPTNGQLSSAYGMRKLKGRKARPHNGIDIKANRGTPVLASGKGKVIFAGHRGSFGRLVEVEHEDGLLTRYAHLDKVMVKKGQVIDSGAKLGTVGKTGRATGYNLHFEVLVSDVHVDPLLVVKWS